MPGFARRASRPFDGGNHMTDTSVPTRFAEGEFRVGNVLNRTAAVLGRHFVTFFIVTVIASVPGVLWSQAALAMTREGAFPVVLSLLGGLLGVVFWTLSQAILLFGAFQDMR